MLKSVGEEMKSIAVKYEAIEKDNVDLKEAVSKIADALGKITKALENPIHKSPGSNLSAEDLKAKAGIQEKSVDPLDLF